MNMILTINGQLPSFTQDIIVVITGVTFTNILIICDNLRKQKIFDH